MKIFNIEIKAFDFCEMNWYNLCYSYKDYDDALKAYHNTKNDLLIEAKNFCAGGVRCISTYEHTHIVNDKENEVDFKIKLNFDFSKEEHINLYSNISLPPNVGRIVEDDFKKSLTQHHNGMYAVQLCLVKLAVTELL
jgi:hypothetical protein